MLPLRGFSRIIGAGEGVRECNRSVGNGIVGKIRENGGGSLLVGWGGAEKNLKKGLDDQVRVVDNYNRSVGNKCVGNDIVGKD